MKGRLTTIAVISVTSLLLMLVLATTIAPAFADTPNEPQNADAMWVEPSTMTLTGTNASVGTEFNVTVWLNMTEDVFAWQVAMLYNRTQLKCTRAGLTQGLTSSYCAGHTTSTPPASIDGSLLGNGSLLYTETCLGADNITGPNSGSLLWAEFQVLIVPTAGNLTSTFDITTKTPSKNWVKAPGVVNIPLQTLGNSNYTIIPEFLYLLILPVFAALTTLAVVMSKKMRKRELQ